jgi:hypothetical protein
MAWLILGASILAAIVLAGSFIANAPPKILVRAFKWIGIGGAVLIVSSLLVTGRAALLFPLILFGVPMARRWLQGGGGRRFPSFGSAPSSGGTSEVKTATLRMELDHDSGTVDGAVIGGRFAGRELGSLSQGDLLALLTECRRDDPESGPLVEAYLDRVHTDWRAEAGEGAGDQTGSDRGRDAYDTPMDAKEARGILELEAEATDGDIKAAHHRLMKKLHPDQGGSTYLASKINQAKDVLLGS